MLVEHLRRDAMHIMLLMFKLGVMPLAKQITKCVNICVQYISIYAYSTYACVSVRFWNDSCSIKKGGERLPWST